MLYQKAPEVAHLLTQELGLASACWVKEDSFAPCVSVLYTLRLQD